MTATLLSTKHYVPQVRGNAVRRPQLLERLNGSPDSKLILISAPAGFGKTTLISSWLQQSARTAAWVSLDEGDNTFFRFWSYVTNALQSVLPGIEPSHPVQTQVSRISESNQVESVRAHLTELINALARQRAAGLDELFTLVLDDYHLISNDSIHNTLAYLFEYLPRGLQIVVSTRTDPPIPIPRLRARGQLTELRTLDLQFSPEETGAFFLEMMGIELSAEEVGVLAERTEGWVAGLQIAGLAIRSLSTAHTDYNHTRNGPTGKGENISNFIQGFSGENEYVFDYLAEEVFQQLSQSDQNFLLSTSILDTMTAEVCQAVSGNARSQAVLRRIAAANLFVIALDDKKLWYRYHQLFADFLRARLRQTSAEMIPKLHRRASLWFEENERLDQAIEHAIKAGDTVRAVELIEQMANTGFVISEPARVNRWLESLPDDAIRANPLLGLAYATALLGLGNLGAIEGYLVGVENVAGKILSEIENGAGHPASELEPETSFKKEQLELFMSRSEAIRAVVACYQGEASRTVELSQRALEILPKDDYFWRGVMAINIALNLSEVVGSETRLVDASDILAEAAKSSYENGDEGTALYALGRRGDTLKVRGKLREAAQDYRQAIQAGGENSWLFPSVGISLVGLGGILYEWNDLEKAEEKCLEAIRLAEKGGDTDVIGESYLLFSRLRFVQGDPSGAITALEKAKEIAGKSKIAWIGGQAEAYQAYYWMRQGRHDLVDEWIERIDLGTGGKIGYRREKEFTMLARDHISRKNWDKALDLLDWLSTVTKEAGMKHTRLEVLILQALAWYRQRNQTRALKAIGAALSMAEPEGYIRSFIDEGPPMGEILHLAVAQGVSLKYAGALLAAFKREKTRPPHKPGVELLPEPLTERELQVLTLIAGGASNREIAETLVLALGTVKKHINNIFGKIGVRSRTQAVKRARELALF